MPWKTCNKMIDYVNINLDNSISLYFQEKMNLSNDDVQINWMNCKPKETAFQGYKNDFLNEAYLIVNTNSENFT